jgi:4-hydroxybenzoate polyprenyltransferase
MERTINVSSISYAFFTILINEFLLGGHMAAIGSTITVFIILLLLNINVILPLLASAYLLTLIVYYYDYYRDAKKDISSNPERALHLAKQVKLYPYIFTSYLFSYIFLIAYLGSLKLIALTIGLVVSGLLYSILFKGFTRHIPGFKNLFTSAVWAMGSVLYIVTYYSFSIGMFFILMFLFIFLKVLVNTIFYDIKDIKADSDLGLKTLPIFLGENKAMILLHILNAAACIPILMGVCINAMPPYALSLTASCFSMAAYLCAGKNLGYTRYILADSETLLWPILLLVGKSVYYGLH